MRKFPESIPIKGRAANCLSFLTRQGIKGKVVVDIGASFGWLEKEIKGMGAKKLVGVEPDSEAVKFAASQVKNASFVQGDALAIPLGSNYADIVCLFDVIEHVPEGTELKALTEARRILKKNGVLLLSTPNDHLIFNFLDPAWYFGHRHYSKEKIKEQIEKSGFKVEKIETRGGFWSYIYLIWLYLASRITGNVVPRNDWLENKDDNEFKRFGFHTLFLVAGKKRRLLY